jgi:hypothetical protein
MPGQSFQVSPVNLGSRAIVEPIVQPLYDSGLVTTTSTTQIQFFQVPLGQGTPTKTLVLTNQEVSGLLPNPKLFVISGFRLHISQDPSVALTSVTDMKIILHQSFFSFDLGGNFKNYLRVPSYMLPSGFGVTGFAVNDSTASSTMSIVNNGAPVISNFFSIGKYPIGLPPLQSYQATLNFPTAPTLTAQTRVWCVLWGIMGREVG